MKRKQQKNETLNKKTLNENIFEFQNKSPIKKTRADIDFVLC